MLITDAVPAPTFANHESFHLRYGWLKKAYNQSIEDGRIFSSDNATIKLGVGKNMVRAIKFWSIANKILQIEGNGKNSIVTPTPIGRILFDDKKGLDPYLENPDTLWLLHWLLFAPPCKVPVWWIIMNEFSATNVDVENLTNDVISQITNISDWNTPSPKSIKKDVSVFIHTYSTRREKLTMEDYLDCPFRQLRMIKQNSPKTIRFVFGKKYGISPAVTAFACLDFIDRLSIKSKTVSISRLATEAGGIGNIFKIHENELAEMLGSVCDEYDLLSMQNINGAQHLVLGESAKKISSDMLTKIYRKKKNSIPKTNTNEAIA